jgi:hypothetical protein
MELVFDRPTLPDGAVLGFTTEPDTGRITLCGLHPAGVHRIGTFRNAADAWAALDEIDSPRR